MTGKQLLIGLIVAAATAFTSGRIDAASFAEVFPIGKTFQSDLAAPFNKVPLPEGTWEVIGAEASRGENL
jgi:hypothetical protein